MRRCFRAWPLACWFLTAAACGEAKAPDPAPTSEGARADSAAAPGAATADDDLLARLNAIEGVSAVEIPAQTPDPEARGFLLEIDQPADHDHPEGPHFLQRATLLHRSDEAPMVFDLGGYAIFGAATFDNELSRIFGGNRLIVEHRFFDPSSPESKDWRLLNIRQAAADHHRVLEALKPLYPAAWTSTGVSKGGMASVYHRRFYPHDVDATVAYVAPQNYAPADPRYPIFLEKVGTASCRQKIVDLQREALKRRERLVPMMVAEGAEFGSTFDLFGDADIPYEIAVIDLRFFVWQFYEPSLCESIPPKNATDEEVYTFVRDIVFFDGYSDAGFEFYAPYYFQGATEIGGAAPAEKHIRDLLRYPGFNTASNMTPFDVDKHYSLWPVVDVGLWVALKSERMLFVYGQNDPWSAGAFEIGKRPDVFRFFAPGGNHNARLADLTEADQAKAYQALSTWTGAPVTPSVASADARLAGADPLARWREERRQRPHSLWGRQHPR